jgi:chromosome segregation ATPase
MSTNGDTIMTDDGEQRIHRRLDELSERIASIDRSTAEIAAACKPCKARVEVLDKQVNGNGNAGLRAEVIGLTGKLKELHEDRKEAMQREDSEKRWMRAQLAAVLTTLLGVLGMAAKYFLT